MDEPRSSPTRRIPYEPHVGASRQYWRDMVLGVNDGLVSIFLLVVGVVGGGLTSDQVLITAVAGAVAGAVSMGAGEYLATKSQDQVLEAELQLEQTHIRHYRDAELGQLRGFFREMGLSGEDLDLVVEAFSRSDRALLNAMAALEFGVVESERRSPTRAMLFSAALFAIGALPSLVPFLFGPAPTVGLVWASALTAVGLFAVGVAKTRVTRGNPWLAGAENLLIAGVGGAVAYAIGVALGGGPV